MRPINRRVSLSHNNLIFIRSENIFRTKHCLPTRFNTACWCKYIIISVALIKLRAFNCNLVIFISIKYLNFITYKPHTIWLHFNHMKYTLITYTTLCNTCYKIGFTIIVPKWARVNPACTRSYINRFTPFSKWVFCCSHIYSFIWHWKTHIIYSLMVSYRRCPHSTAMNWISISKLWYLI